MAVGAPKEIQLGAAAGTRLREKRSKEQASVSTWLYKASAKGQNQRGVNSVSKSIFRAASKRTLKGTKSKTREVESQPAGVFF